MEGVKEVSLGWYHSAAIVKNGDLYMWGNNGDGELGDGTIEEKYKPVKIMEEVKKVSLGSCHSAAITEKGELYIWGYNGDGELGDGTTEDKYKPVKIMNEVEKISLGNSHSAAITEKGELYMWGANDYGQLGDGTTENRYEPVKIMEGVKEVSLGNGHSAAITEKGELYMWGANDYGQLGDGTTENRYEPVKIMEGVKKVSLGCAHSAVITEKGELYMWGWNIGQLGDGTTENRYKPVKIMNGVNEVSLGWKHSAAITKKGKLYIWGVNDWGQLGDGTYETKYVPTKIEIPSANTYSLLSKIMSYTDDTVSQQSLSEISQYNGLVSNEIYNFYVLKSDALDDVVSSDNLLYITQVISDTDGNLTIPYETKETYDRTKLLLVGMNDFNIKDAEIVVDNIKCTGEEQFVSVRVAYNGALLKEGIDYSLLGDYAVTNEGKYILIIEGMGKYQGSVNKSFDVTSGVLSGDVNNDKKINIQDAVILKKYLAGYIDENVNEDSCDINGDGNITSQDAVILLKHLAGYDVKLGN